MIFLSGQQIIKNSIGQPGGIASLDLSGKVELTQAPPSLINSYFDSSESDAGNIQTVLEGMSAAYKGDIVGFSVLGVSYILKQNPYSTFANWTELKTTAANTQKLNGKTEAQIRDTLIPIGFSYTEYPDSTGFNHRLPGDTLKNYDNTDCTYSQLGFATQGDYDTAKAGCAYPGTSWKLAIIPGDFDRQSNEGIADKKFGTHKNSTAIGEAIVQSNGLKMINTDGIDSFVEYNTDGLPGSNIGPKPLYKINPDCTAIRKWKRIA